MKSLLKPLMKILKLVFKFIKTQLSKAYIIAIVSALMLIINSTPIYYFAIAIMVTSIFFRLYDLFNTPDSLLKLIIEIINGIWEVAIEPLIIRHERRSIIIMPNDIVPEKEPKWDFMSFLLAKGKEIAKHKNFKKYYIFYLIANTVMELFIIILTFASIYMAIGKLDPVVKNTVGDNGFWSYTYFSYAVILNSWSLDVAPQGNLINVIKCFEIFSGVIILVILFFVYSCFTFEDFKQECKRIETDFENKKKRIDSILSASKRLVT
jgi:hypothetical protein